MIEPQCRWWKGEVDGRVGVFPDNFVKLITTPTANNQQQNNTEEVRGDQNSGGIRMLEH